MDHGYACTAVFFDYCQRHQKERFSALRIARVLGVKLYRIKLSLPWLRVSSLVDHKKKLPYFSILKIGAAIPSTYVPGRNLMFASIGVSLADSIGAEAVVMGPNIVDYSGYPDCRPRFNRAFREVARQGTRRGCEGRGIAVRAPLERLDKATIVRLARRLRVPLELTWSCYRGGRKPCGVCDSCQLRARGFAAAGVSDPAL